MLDHIGLSVADCGHFLAFYERALAPLDHGPVLDPVGHNLEAMCHTP